MADNTQRAGEQVTLMGRPRQGPVALGEVAVLLDPVDAVAIATQPLLPRTPIGSGFSPPLACYAIGSTATT